MAKKWKPGRRGRPPGSGKILEEWTGMTFSVKNWSSFQHYKKRGPRWIKLYSDLLDDYTFFSLPEPTRLHLVMIWLLASRMDNKIPDDAEWVANKIGAKTAVNLDLLEDAGFIQRKSSRNASHPSQTVASPEGEGEGETEREPPCSPPAGGSPKRKAKAATTIPESLLAAIPDFEELWAERRQANRKGSEKAQLRMLASRVTDPELGADYVRWLVEQATMGGWQGIEFPDSQEKYRRMKPGSKFGSHQGVDYDVEEYLRNNPNPLDDGEVPF